MLTVPGAMLRVGVGAGVVEGIVLGGEGAVPEGSTIRNPVARGKEFSKVVCRTENTPV